MRRPHRGTLFCLACVSILTLAVSASAAPKIGGKQNGLNLTEERGLHVYVDCWDAFKSRCGRNIVDDGLASGNPPSQAKVKEWTATMERWLNPPEPVAMSSPATTSQVAPTPATTSVAPTSAGGCPSYMADEASYSTQYNAEGSGAYGCYQIMPGTAASYGCDLSSVEGQTACAGAICADVGASAWVSSGADPCPYVQP